MKIRTIILLLILLGAVIGAGYWSVNSFRSAGQPSEDPTTKSSAEGKTQDKAVPLATANSLLLPTENTPPNYVPPKYDPFNNQYRPQTDYEEVIPPDEKQPNIPPAAEFTVLSKRPGFAEKYSGTVGTEFVFNASGSSDHETPSNRLQVRWDFENDGELDTWDTFFSRIKTARHTYHKAGTYFVTLEVLDRGGAVASKTRQITIVNNTSPTPHFSFKPEGGTTNTVIVFNTNKSSDSQYLKSYLEYRFDWDSDGIWDTEYNRKTVWRHKFEKSGVNRVVMEAKDPEGATASSSANLSITENIPPVANFVVETKQRTLADGTTETTYSFDASSSYDSESGTKKLLYRWDFNYTGRDDIVFDTQFSSSPRHSGNYSLPGQKTVRLQVKDEDGAVSEVFGTSFGVN